MKKEKRNNQKVVSLLFSSLNRPKTDFSLSGVSDVLMENFYNAAGQKLKKTVFYSDSIKIVDYLDGFQYAGNVLQFFPHPEGYVKATPLSLGGNITEYAYNYVFNYTDHLGNVRLSYSKDPQTHQLKILEENHYYPFGLRHSVYSGGRLKGFKATLGSIGGTVLTPVTKTDYQYKYNGKEWQDELGLNFYDYGARNYDPAIGRWMNVDPLAEEYSNLSIYNYVNNNPIRFVDPTGMKGEDFINIKINTQKNEVSIERIQAKGDDEVRIIKDGEVTDSYKYGENGSFAEDAKIEKLYIGTTKMIGVVFNDFNNLEKAEKFYKFAAKSGVEFGHVSLVDFNTNEFQSIVMTSGAKRSVPYTNYAYKLMRNNPGLHMLEGSHSHPNGNYNENYGGPSGFDYNSLKPNNVRGDRRNFIDGKNEFKGRMPEYLNVYFPSSPNIDVKYNGNEAIRTKK